MDMVASLENRIARLTVRDYRQLLNEVWPEEYPLFVRLSATEWTEGGWTDRRLGCVGQNIDWIKV
jgi:2,4-dienoyl-CoA reductase-like NADH-dependent reductase (Old Yellow Enzyme family)